MNTCKALYITLIALFIILNYAIIAVGHELTYDLETNKCTHMSRRLEGMFERFGVPVTLKVGSNNNNERHMWIKIAGVFEMDSVNLLPVVNSEYNQRIVEYESFDDYEKTRQ